MPDAPKVIDPVEAQRALDLIQDLWNDKVVGPALHRKAKEKYPSIRLPEEQFAPFLEPLTAKLDELSAKLKERDEEISKRDKEREDRAQKRQNDQFASSLDDAVKKFNLTDDGRKAMIERMQETKAYDPYAAAAYIVSQAPPAIAGPVFGPQALNFAGSAEVAEDRKLLHRDPAAYFDSEVRKMLTNPRDYVAQEMGENYARMSFGD